MLVSYANFYFLRWYQSTIKLLKIKSMKEHN